jgi:hypothetical protein
MKSIYLQYYKVITLNYFNEASSHPVGHQRQRQGQGQGQGQRQGQRQRQRLEARG